jgi:hypothetical protein
MSFSGRISFMIALAALVPGAANSSHTHITGWITVNNDAVVTGISRRVASSRPLANNSARREHRVQLTLTCST